MPKMGLLFDGVDDRVEVADSPSLSLATAITIALRVKPITFPTGPSHIVGKPANEQYDIYISGGGGATAILKDAGGTRRYTSFGTLALGTSVHLAVTYDGVACRTYTNGVYVASTAFVGLLPNVDPLLLTGLLSDQHILKEVQLYSRALSAHEILRRMKGLPVPDGLVLHFDFQYERGSDGTGRIRDLSPYGNHGTNGAGVAAQMAKQVPIPDFPPTFKKRRQVE